MIALGCKYLRICHLNNCATGVATQNSMLREKHYHGLPERVMTYFEFVAAEVREWMAKLGVSQFDELVGHSEWLKTIEGHTSKQQALDLSPILYKPEIKPGSAATWQEINTPDDKGELNLQLVDACQQAVDKGETFTAKYVINNTNRSIGATLSGYIAKRHGVSGCKEPLQLEFQGTAGQSFGVWNSPGVNLRLIGDANDYVGKGMSGGSLTLYPAVGSNFKTERSAIIGNTCLYGATGGKLFAAGQAGERFAVRNSGAIAVVEGLGDNGCEYMTGGIVVVLGKTGVNFGAGMTGGFAYVFDRHGDFEKRVNNELVDTHAISNPIQQQHLKGLIEEHVERTNSEHAKMLLSDFENWVDCFVLVKPKSMELADLLKNEQGGQVLSVKAG